MALYDGYARPCGKYASELEAEWARKFRFWGWSFDYVGDGLDYADFLVKPGEDVPFFVEVKPEPHEKWVECPYIRQAAQRLRAACIDMAIILSGRPGWNFWIGYCLKKQDGYALQRVPWTVTHYTLVPKAGEPVPWSDPADPSPTKGMKPVDIHSPGFLECFAIQPQYEEWRMREQRRRLHYEGKKHLQALSHWLRTFAEKKNLG